jgi:hypothetical protein
MSTRKENHGRPDVPPVDRGPHTITVTVDDQPKEVKPGNRLVSDFKSEVGVDASRVLTQFIDGEFKTLTDSDRVHPKGGEIFVSHVRTGGSS